MKLIHFTAPSGARVEINPDDVEELKENDGSYPGAKTVIVLVSGVQAVRESIADVEKALLS